MIYSLIPVQYGGGDMVNDTNMAEDEDDIKARGSRDSIGGLECQEIAALCGNLADPST